MKRVRRKIPAVAVAVAATVVVAAAANAAAATAVAVVVGVVTKTLPMTFSKIQRAGNLPKRITAFSRHSTKRMSALTICNWLPDSLDK